MKISKIFAGMSALAIAASMAVVASADYVVPSDAIDWPADGNGTAYIYKDEDGVDNGTALFTNLDDLKGLTGIKWTITCADAADPEVWYGGAFGVNSSVSGWDATQWCVNEEEPAEGKVAATKIDDTTYEVVMDVTYDDVIEEDEEKDYFRTVFQNYGPEVTFTCTLLGVGDSAPAADPEPEPESQDEAPSQDETPSQDPAPAPDTTPAPSGDGAGAGGGNGGDAAEAGAAAGIALAGLAVAGAALVATKRK